MCGRILLLFCLSACLCVQSSTLLSQDNQSISQTVGVYAPVGFRVLKNTILPALNKTLAPQEREVLARIEWRFPAMANAMNARAFVDPGSKASVIEISGGHVYLLDLLVDASLLAIEFDKEDMLADFFIDLVKTIRTNMDAHTRGAAEMPVPSFIAYASIPADAAERYQRTPDYQVKRQANLASGLALVVTHELGHHLLKHTLSRSASMSEARKREADADAFAARATDAAGFSAVSVTPLMGLLASMEGDSATADAADHPPAVCRQVQFTVSASPSLLKNPMLEKLLSENPKMRPKFNAFAASLPSLSRFDEFCCADGARSKPECWPTARSRETSVGYCIPLLTALRAASTGFEALKGEARDGRSWNSGLRLLHVTGCHVDSDRSSARLVCEDGYLDDEAEWQASYAQHTAAIARCGTFIGTKWDTDKDDDPDGTQSTVFSPEDNDDLGRVSVQRRRDNRGRMFVRLVIRPQ